MGEHFSCKPNLDGKAIAEQMFPGEHCVVQVSLKDAPELLKAVKEEFDI